MTIDRGVETPAVRPGDDWARTHRRELEELERLRLTPVWARGVAPETLAGNRPAGGYDPTDFERIMTEFDEDSRRSRPPTNEQSVARHAGPAWLDRGEQLGTLGSDLLASTRANVARGGKAVERIAGGATSYLTKDQVGTKETDPLGAVGEFGGAVLSTIFDPILEPIQRSVVLSDPELKRRYDKLGGGMGAAHQVLEELRTAAKNRAEDQSVPAGDRADAAGIATILSIQKLSEFGAPQAVAGLTRLGRAAIRNQLAYEARTASPAGAHERLMEIRGGDVVPPGAYSRIATGEGELAAGRTRAGAAPASDVAIPAWARSLEESAARTGTAGARPGQVAQNDILREAIERRSQGARRGVATRQDLEALEDKVGAKQAAGYYADNPQELVNDIAHLARIRMVVERPTAAVAPTSGGGGDYGGGDVFGGGDIGDASAAPIGPVRDPARHVRWEADRARDAAMSDEDLTKQWLGNYNAETGRFDGMAVRIAIVALNQHPGARAVLPGDRQQFAQDAATLAVTQALKNWDRGRGPFGAVVVPRVRGQVADAIREMDSISRGAVKRNKLARESGVGSIEQRPIFESLDSPVENDSGQLEFVAREIGSTETKLATSDPSHPAYQAVLELAKGLTEQEQRVFERMYVGGGTLMDVGADVGISESGVSRAAKRVREKLLAAVEASENPILEEFLALAEKRALAMAEMQARAVPGDRPGFVPDQEVFSVKQKRVVGRGREPLPGAPGPAAPTGSPAGAGAPSVGATKPARGGARVGAGRPRAERPYTWEQAQPVLEGYTPAHREIVTAALQEGLSTRKIADRVGLSQTRVTRIIRAFDATMKKLPPISGGSGDPMDYGGGGGDYGGGGDVFGGGGGDVSPATGEQLMEQRVTGFAQKYGLGAVDEAAAAIEAARAGTAAPEVVALVAKMPRPLQDEILGHALFGNKPLRDEATILAELEEKTAGAKAAELEWRRLRKRKTRTVFNKKTGVKVTHEGASQAAVNFAESQAEELASQAEQLTAELTYGRETRALGPTKPALEASVQRAKAAVLPERGPLIPPPELLPEAPVETRRRHSFAAGVQVGKREAVDALRAKVQQAIDELARGLVIDDAEAPTSARKIAAALKQIADDAESTIPRLKIGKKGATSKNTSEYRKAFARDVQPYVDLRKNITDAIEGLRNIEKGGLLDWEKMSVVDQVEWLQQKFSKLTALEEFRTEIANAADYETRQALVEELNDYTARFYRWEQEGGLEPGSAPIDLPDAPYPKVGHGLPGAAAIKLQREQLIADLKAHLEQAADLGVDTAIVNPVWKATSQALEQVKTLRDELEKVASEAGVPVEPGPEAEMVGSLNLDYIADPLMREAIRANYLRRAPEIEAATRAMSVQELAQNAKDLSAMVGGDPQSILEFVAGKVPKRGDVSVYIFLTRITMAEQALELRRLATRNITDERWDKALATFDAFIEELNPAVSEAGRTLRFQQLVVGREAAKAGELEQPVRTAEILANEKNKQWRDAVAAAEQAAQKALTARAKAEALKNPLDDARARTAEGAAQKAQDAADQLKIAYDRIEMAKIAAEDRRRAARMQFLTEGLIQARKKGATPEMLRALASLDPDRDFQQIVNLLRNIEPASGGEKLTGFVLNNMYSGIRSNEANILGNSFQLGRLLMLDPIAARTTAPLISLVSGREPAIVSQEFRFALMALQHGTPRALRNFLNIMQKGRGASDISEEIPAGSKFELGAPDLFPGPLGLLAEGALRMLSGVDAAFFHLSYVMEYDTMLARLAVMKGAKTHQEIADKMVDFIIDPPEKLNEFAGKTAAEMTYRQELDRITDAVVRLVSTPIPLPERIPLPGKIRDFEIAQVALSEAKSPADTQAAQELYNRSSLPFLGDTPMFKWFLTPIMFTANAAKTAVQFAGGGLLSAPYHAWRTGQALRLGKITAEEAEYFDRVAARTGLIGAAGALLLGDAIIAFVNDDLTGEGPDDPEARRVWLQTHQQFSRRVNGQWHRYDQVWPAGASYTFVARVGEAIQDGRLKEQDALEITARGFAAFGTALLDQPFLRNIAGFNDFLDNLNRGGATRAVESYAATIARKFEWYSAFWNDLGRTLDPYERDPQTFLEFIEAKLPLISQGVRTRLDRWGSPVSQKPGGAGQLMPGAGVKPDDDPVNTEVSRLEALRENGEPILAMVSFVSKEIGGIELDPDERHYYQEQAGQLAHAEIAALMGTVSWSGWDDKRKAKEVRLLVNHAREEARRQVANKLMGVTEMPDGTAAQVADTGPENRARGLRIGLSAAQSAFQRVKLVEKWLPAFETDPELTAAFETHKGEDPWGVKDYRELAPKVKWLEEQPEFATPEGKPVGDQAQWNQYHAEYREWKKVDRESGPVAARLYFLSKPVLRVFTQLAQRTGGKNAAVTIARLNDPRLKRIVLPRDEDTP